MLPKTTPEELTKLYEEVKCLKEENRILRSDLKIAVSRWEFCQQRYTNVTNELIRKNEENIQLHWELAAAQGYFRSLEIAA